MVVHPVPAGVVPRIMQRDVGERRSRWSGRTGQQAGGCRRALGTHLRLRIQGLRDRGVVGSSSTPTACTPSGARPMKVPAPQPGSRTRPAGEAEPSHRAPHLGGDHRVGVVGVDSGAARGRVLGVAEHLVELVTISLKLGPASRQTPATIPERPTRPHRASTRCSSAVAARCSACTRRNVRNASRFAVNRARAPDGARSSCEAGRKAGISVVIPVESAGSSPSAGRPVAPGSSRAPPA